MSKNPNMPDRCDMAELTSIHGDFTDRVNDMAMVMQDQSYIVGRKRGLEEGREQRADLLEALQRIANNFDESWAAGCVERQMGDIARAAILKATGEQQ